MQPIDEYILAYPEQGRLVALAGLSFFSALGIMPTTTDIVMVVAGMLLYKNLLPAIPSLVICFVTVAAGEIIMYELGHNFGKKLIRIWPLTKILSEKKLIELQEKLQRSEKKIIWLVRLTPPLRPWMILGLSTLGLSRKEFYGRNFILLLLYVPLIIGVSTGIARYTSIDPQWLFFVLVTAWCTHFIFKKLREHLKKPKQQTE